MLIKRAKGPAGIRLPDGSLLTKSDLPDARTRRWVSSRKLKVVQAVVHGLIEKEEALNYYDLTSEELDTWIAAHEVHGQGALRTTAIQKYRNA